MGLTKPRFLTQHQVRGGEFTVEAFGHFDHGQSGCKTPDFCTESSVRSFSCKQFFLNHSRTAGAETLPVKSPRSRVRLVILGFFLVLSPEKSANFYFRGFFWWWWFEHNPKT